MNLAGDQIMRLCKSGMFAAAAYLAVEATLLAVAYMHPSGVLYEYIPFMLGELPWGFLFMFSGYAQLLAIPLNVLLLYCFCSWISSLRRREMVNKRPVTSPDK